MNFKTFNLWVVLAFVISWSISFLIFSSTTLYAGEITPSPLTQPPNPKFYDNLPQVVPYDLTKNKIVQDAMVIYDKAILDIWKDYIHKIKMTNLNKIVALQD